jgi:hypothetical protein
MATGKQRPSKQKRSNQNRQQRAARQARTTNAAAPPVTPKASSGTTTSSASSSSAEKTSLLGRLRGGSGGATRPAARPAASSRTGGTSRAAAPDPVDLPPMTDKRGQPVGYRAALTCFLAALAAVGASLLFHTAVDAQGDPYSQPSLVAEWSHSALDATADLPADAEPAAVVKAVDDWMPNRSSERIFTIYFPWTLAALLPIGASFLLLRAVRERRGARTVNRAMYATLLGSVICLPLLQFFFPTLGAAWFAGYQVRRAEMAAIRAQGGEDGGAGSSADDEVIEADVVDDEA